MGIANPRSSEMSAIVSFQRGQNSSRARSSVGALVHSPGHVDRQRIAAELLEGCAKEL